MYPREISVDLFISVICGEVFWLRPAALRASAVDVAVAFGFAFGPPKAKGQWPKAGSLVQV